MYWLCISVHCCKFDMFIKILVFSIFYAFICNLYHAHWSTPINLDIGRCIIEKYVNCIWHIFLVFNDNVLNPEFMWHQIRADERSLAACALLLKSYYLWCQQYFNGQMGKIIRLVK